MSDREQNSYTIEALPFLPSYQRFTLTLVPHDDPLAPVYVKAALADNISGYEFDNPEDAKFNLSSVLGNENGAFIWGRAGFEQTARGFNIVVDDSTHEQLLVAQLQNFAGEYQEAKLSLHKHLDIVEYLNKKSREVMRKLGEKRAASQRSVVLCFDGTSNHFSNLNTNVVKFVELLKKNDPEQQVVYYQTGVGTYAPPGMLTNLGLTFAAKADEGIAWFLYQHVLDGYKYLMQTYQAGDQISIFGFSRGAYTARALAGMIHSVGLLPKHNLEHAPFAYQIYESSTEEKKVSTTPNPLAYDKKSALPQNVDPDDFKRTFCIPIKIAFLGVWDTVGSVGAFNRKELPWIEYNPSVYIFRQALALDENRGNFIPSVWDHSRTDVNYQDALEVWFKGGHADIGGGAVPKEGKTTGQLLSRPLLSNITLRWMVRQCFDLDTNIIFDLDSMRRYRKALILELRPLNEDTTKLQERVDELDQVDIKPDPYIALDESPWWKVLEYIPVPKLSQIGERSHPQTAYSPNAGSARCINYREADPIRLHSSVVNSILEDKKYFPAATWCGYEKRSWPEIEEGTMSSIISEGDEVVKNLKMSWDVPEVQGSWFKPSTWSLWGKPK
ncbi:hypothetical protein BDV93DRAFT_608607 [Ceratobasidium sp. AG-I]|nr:hypothetical protein BDV93DRAFT_608607 [Ceratobasidium sp. AG-I]